MRLSLLLIFAPLLTAPIYSQNLEEQLLGKWMMNEVIQGGEDVTVQHNPKKNRYFIFKEDGTFETGGDPYGFNTGRFFINNLNSTLYIDSNQGPDDDSMWYLSIKDDRLKWNGFGTEWAEVFELILVRSR